MKLWWLRLTAAMQHCPQKNNVFRQNLSESHRRPRRQWLCSRQSAHRKLHKALFMLVVALPGRAVRLVVHLAV